MAAQKTYAQIALWIVLFVLLILLVTPVIWTIFGSFKSNTDIFNHPFSLPSSLSFGNYVDAWELAHFNQYFYNTSFITVFGLVMIVCFATMAGYVFGQISFKGNNLLFYAFLVGMTLPPQTIIIPLFYQLKSLGLVNTLWGVVFASVGNGMPFAVFLMRNMFRGLPKELRESAYMDGAREWNIFLKVMAPLAKPGIFALVIFTFRDLWNEYLIPLVLLIHPDKFTIAIGISALQTEQSSNYSVIFAGAVISMIPILILYLIFQRQFIEGITSGAQKG